MQNKDTLVLINDKKDNRRVWKVGEIVKEDAQKYMWDLIRKYREKHNKN